MKRILCFGDSLTWGYDPAKRVRFEEDRSNFINVKVSAIPGWW
jgi:lysophospholipase L1-like esterase